jgi:NAD(P)-dependent dehydrogenase (short-subunit alcohol dehydrogenase family)
MARLDDKVAIVTGGASGIGAACSRTLAREGATVVLTDIDATGGDGVAAAIKDSGGEAVFLSQDVTSEARWVEVAAEIGHRFGRLDIVVANAGIGIGAQSIVEVTLDDWRRLMAINLDGVFLTVKHCLPLMRRAGNGGSIIMMSSIAGLRGSPTLAGYSASKGAVRLFAKSIAMECAGFGDGIRVNSVHPGIIATPIWEKIPAPVAPGGGGNATVDPREYGRLVVPLGVAGEAEDIADGVLFLASEQSRHMTGAELVIDGGMTGGAVRRRSERNS